jgi:hypothetical protein
MTETPEHVIYTGLTRTTENQHGKRVRYRKNKHAAALRAFRAVAAAKQKEENAS